MRKFTNTIVSTFLIVAFLTLYNLNAKQNKFVEFYIPNLLAFGLLALSNINKVKFNSFLELFILGFCDFIYIVILFKQAAHLSLPLVLININFYNGIWISAVCFTDFHYFFFTVTAFLISGCSYLDLLSKFLYYDSNLFFKLNIIFIIFYTLFIFLFQRNLFASERYLAILICLIANCFIDWNNFKQEGLNFFNNFFNLTDHNTYIRIIYVFLVFFLFKCNNCAYLIGLVYNFLVLIILFFFIFVFKYDSYGIWRYAEYRTKKYLIIFQFALLIFSNFILKLKTIQRYF